MTKRPKFRWIKAVSIVPVLFAMGLILCKLEVMAWFGRVTIFISVFIGVVYGVLGILGVLASMGFIETNTIKLTLMGLFSKADKYEGLKSRPY